MCILILRNLCCYKLWKVGSRFPHKLQQISFIVRMCVTTYNISPCRLCNVECEDFIVHFFCYCPKLNNVREKFWDFISNNYRVELEVELNNLSDYELVNCIFGIRTKGLKGRERKFRG